MAKTQSLSIDLPRIDGNTQSRIAINDDVVQDYADMIGESNGDWPFPPLDIFHDGTDHYVADGFHRFLAAHRAKRGSIPCRIHNGTATDARIFGMTANDKHGLRMTREDKRSCVEWLLDNGGKMSQKEVASKAGVGRRMVQMIVADRNPASIAGKASLSKLGGEAQNAPNTTISGNSGDEADSEPDGQAQESAQNRGSRVASGARTGANGKNHSQKPDYGKCPNCAGSKWTEDSEGVTCSKCQHPHGEPVGDADESTVKKREPTPADIAKAQIKVWAETVGRWLGGSPRIDEYRKQFPGPKGDLAVKKASELHEALKNWRGAIK